MVCSCSHELPNPSRFHYYSFRVKGGDAHGRDGVTRIQLKLPLRERFVRDGRKEMLEKSPGGADAGDTCDGRTKMSGTATAYITHHIQLHLFCRVTLNRLAHQRHEETSAKGYSWVMDIALIRQG
ncbi:hypothetical protein EVAR_84990_1 [Eumeta japonica]|uniref:Uncharacterized protein n=1 Tax=Eumeta variegata TaxID=151549 RepID=A0A4C1W7Q7_EUMVA|nr:hypothetical protein EVAR_84990_1 [Eumeta japonica]